MDFQQIEDEKGGRCIALENGEEQAYISYQVTGEREITIDHTVVHPQAQGKGLARLLLDVLVDRAREKGEKIVAECSYVAKVFEKDDCYSDVKG